jgi:hypothetical protein
MKRRKIKQSSDNSRKRTMNDNKEPAINIFDPERHVTKSQKYGTALRALPEASEPHTSERAAPWYGLIGHRSIYSPRQIIFSHQFIPQYTIVQIALFNA